MKIILILALTLELFAFDRVTASKIFDKIFQALVPQEKVLVYAPDEMYADVIANSVHLSLSDDSKKADVILVNTLKDIPKGSENKLLFATSYLVYKQNKNAVGAFYWDRGHIKIEFSKKRLRDKNVSLPESFEKYIQDDT